MKSKVILLAGSGHAHLEFILALSKKEVTEHKFILLSPSRQTYYSGLIPRYISGEINSQSLTIKSADFAKKQGLDFIQDSITSIDEKNQTVDLKSGKSIKYDLLSLNIGGTTMKIPSLCPDQTIYVRPFEDFVPKWQDFIKNFKKFQNPRFIVVGGGAAAVEIATALRIKLNNNQDKKEIQSPHGEVHLISQSSRLCHNYSEKISLAIKKSLLDFKIQIHLNQPVQQIGEKKIIMINGESLDFDYIFIVTPSEPSKLIPRKVDEMLRLSPLIFAVGDGTEMQNHPRLPRSGVIAVHQGRHLILNIRNALRGGSLLQFMAPAKQLNILITGLTTARLIWGGLSLEGQWVLRLKNWIDDGYMKKFIFSKNED